MSNIEVADEKVESTVNTQNRSEGEILAGLPVKVLTQRFGELRVREFTLENVIEFVGDIVAVVRVLQTDETVKSGKDGAGNLIAIIKNPVTFLALKRVASVACEKKVEDFDKLVLSDWLKILDAITRVNDMEMLKQVFFQMMPENAKKVFEA